MAALTRDTKSTYVIHDRVEAETTDREDHTFCGIMFPVKCKEILPVDHVVINSVAVRGALGPLTVWVTKDENLQGEISMSRRHWTKIYERTHTPSFTEYKELDLSSDPVVLRPGQVRGIYIHSTRRGDEAIVYDNKENRKTHDDSFITIMPGRAHVSEKAFGSVPIWGWGSAWRDNREFVGQIKYGACYRLWSPGQNPSFGSNFRSAARVLLLCQRRTESPFSWLPDDCLYYILHMMRWDWVNDTGDGMRREQKTILRRRRQQMIAEADAVMEEVQGRGEEIDNAESPVVQGGFAVGNRAWLGGDNVAENDHMDEDSSDDSEDADFSVDDTSDDANNNDAEAADGNNSAEDSDDSDSEESTGSDVVAWGDHVGSRNALVYNNDDSDSGSSDDEAEGGVGGEERRRRSALLRARRAIYSILRST
ncbi:hypothetical protein ACHAWF_015540 [Thalassiosira exigua]